MGTAPTRTPEGEPGRCPVCGQPARVEPSTFPMPDAPCPSCGHLLLLSGDPARETGGLDPVAVVLAEMDAAIRRNAERLGLPVEAPVPTVPSEPVRLSLQEVTDVYELLILESQDVSGG